MQSHWLKVINKFVCFIWQIIPFKLWIVFDWLICASDIETKPRRRTVMVVIHMSENVCWLLVVVLFWTPYHLHGPVLESQALVLVVDSGEKERLHAHSAEHGGWWGLVAERIDMPSCSWDGSKSLFQPPVPDGHLINKVLIIWGCFVRHAPSSIKELDLPVCVQSSHSVSLGLVGLVPPSVKEGNFDYRELVGTVFAQLLNNRVNSVLNACELSWHVSTIIIVIHCF